MNEYKCPEENEDCTDEKPCVSCCDHEFDDGEGGYCINGCEAHASDVL